MIKIDKPRFSKQIKFKIQIVPELGSNGFEIIIYLDLRGTILGIFPFFGLFKADLI